MDQRLGEWPAVVNGSYGLNNPMTQGVNFEWTDGPIYKGIKRRDYCYYNLNLTKRAEYMYLGADSNTYYFLVNGIYFRRALRHGNGMDKMHVLFPDGHQEALADTEVRDWEWGMAPWQNSTVKLSPYSLGPLP